MYGGSGGLLLFGAAMCLKNSDWIDYPDVYPGWFCISWLIDYILVNSMFDRLMYILIHYCLLTDFVFYAKLEYIGCCQVAYQVLCSLHHFYKLSAARNVGVPCQ